MSAGRERVIGIITDFGDSPYTGILRAVILSIDESIRIVDIDHSVPNQSIISGAYVLVNTYNWLPKGSTLLVVVDPGVGGAREAIAVEAGDYYFVGPNNGVLYPAVARERFKKAVKLDAERIASYTVKLFRGKLPTGKWTISSTFHGRDIFAPAAALVSRGIPLEELGEPIQHDTLKRTILEQVEKTENGYRLKIIYIDKFGNIALSARQGLLPLNQWSKAVIVTDHGSYNITIGRKFSDVPPGDLILYVNSFGFLEVAVNMGSAAKKLGLNVGDKIILSPI